MRKVFVRKRVSWREGEEGEVRAKVGRLKGISHRNTINLRSAEEGPGWMDLFYQYVPVSLEESFAEYPSQTVKQLHRQFIELAIFLAKNCILTSFSPARCGVVAGEGGSVLKFYLPLPEIAICLDRNVLERSVQLFNVQSMHYLDTLAGLTLNSTIHESSSQRTFRNRPKLFQKQEKARRDSQPTAALPLPHERRMSSKPDPRHQIRKLSSLSRELSEISEIHKRHRASTRVSGGSFNTFKSILSLRSQQEHSQNAQEMLPNGGNILRRCLSQNGLKDVV